MKSVVFEASSSALCIATGNVWLDHFHPLISGCLEASVVRAMNQQQQQKAALAKDTKTKKEVDITAASSIGISFFDWTAYQENNDRNCLRLKASAFKASINEKGKYTG